MSNAKIEDPSVLSANAAAGGGPTVNFAIAPMMHGAGQVTMIRCLIHGDTGVVTPKFDAEQTWHVIQDEKVNVLGITGDAMARPLADSLEEIIDDVDLSSLFSIGSSAAIFSQSIKDQLMERLPNIVVVDSVGATETGMNGIKIAVKGEIPKGGPATVQPSLDSIVVDEHYVPIVPGSGEIGRIARTGNIPLGYYNDPERSAQVFFEHEGKRYSIPGDFATIEADGQPRRCGWWGTPRCSRCRGCARCGTGCWRPRSGCWPEPAYRSANSTCASRIFATIATGKAAA